jgi:hypothetical protein
MIDEQPPIAAKPIGYWKEQIDLAVSTRQTYETWWEANLKAYAPPPGSSPEKYASEVNTNRDFTIGERKSADMFYQRPDVVLQPTPLMDTPLGMGPSGQPIPASLAIQAHQEIVNEKLGEDGIDTIALMDAVKFDIQVTAGFGWTVMGYEQVSVDVEQPHPLDPEGLMGLPPVTVPVPIHQHCFWEHLSPKQVLIPHNHRNTRFDRAPWLGYKFELPLTPGNRKKFKLPEDYAGKKTDGTLHFDHGTGQSQATEDVFTGTHIWYKSHLFREDRPHPEHLTELVIVDGVDEPVIEQDCKYQTLDQKGGLSPDSLVGFPIHVFCVRTMTDSAYVPSDSTMIRPLVNELNISREQQIEQRDTSLVKFGYDVTKLPQDVIAKAVRARTGGMIGLPPEAFPLENSIVELPQGSMPRESFVSNDYIDNDIARTVAIDSAGAGVQSGGSSTATEQQIVAANANARLDKERGVLLKQYLRGVVKFSTLLQRYLSLEDAAQIVGQERAQLWDGWRKTVPSALSFTAMPDSALRVDQAVDRKQSQELYSFLANDPFVNRQGLLTKLLRKFHLDPATIVQQPPPPQPGESKAASVSFKGEDLVAPQAPIVMEMLMQAGWKISPEAILQSQQLLLNAQMMAQAEAEKAAAEGSTKHGGKTAQQESLSKHAADKTGGMQGTGGPAALGAPGGGLQ